MPDAQVVPIAEQLPAQPTQIIPKTYPKKFMACRAMGHEWSHVPELADHPYFRYIKGLVSECLGCGVVRFRWVLSNGRKFGTKYEYPDGYQVSKKNNPDLIRRPEVREWREKYVRTLGFREENVEADIKADMKKKGRIR